MTFNKAPSAIDGARTTASLIRVGSYANGGGRSGVVRPTDLRVQALTTPGNGLRITSGSATILNRYQTAPNESYVVSNPSTHVVGASTMPAPAPGVRYYLVCVVVGDPEFNQTGHPYMPGTPLSPEVAADYEYVRIVVVPCTASTVSFDELGFNYPAYALARLEVPANTTTITSAMIVNLRTLAQPRSDRIIRTQSFTVAYSLNYGDGVSNYHFWTDFNPTVAVPPWATRATVIATMAGVLAIGGGSTNGFTRVSLGPLTNVGASVPYDEDPPNGGYTGGSKSTMVTSAFLDVSTLAGTDAIVGLQGSRDVGEAGYLTTWGGTQLIYDIQFDEYVIA